MLWTPVIAALGLMLLVMASAWAFSVAIRNAGWTDVFWSFGSGAALVLAALWPAPDALGLRQWLVAAMSAVWAGRLAGHMARRVASHPEDARYAEFRAEQGRRFNLFLGFIALPQAPATALLAISVAVAAQRPAPALDLRDLLGVAILALAVAGEALADRQMVRFKADPANRGRVCDVGLWAWSRHPNYFFEWIGWFAYSAIALAPARPMTWFALSAPVVMYLLLTRVSGVPPLEKALERSKGAAYRSYQARVSTFFPRPPKALGQEPAR
jgi:steroid 5-alpha reductase family enzyme